MKVSHSTVLRLSRYLRYLEELKVKELDRTSSADIAEALGLTPSQVRQDLASFGSYGSQGYGYNVPALCNEAKMILGESHWRTSI